MSSMKKRLSVVAAVVSLAAIAVLSVAVGVTEGDSGKATLVLNVDVDESTYVGPELGVEAGPFNVEGTFGGGGSFRCSGWLTDEGSGSVSQVFNFPDRGEIMTQGIEGGFLAVTGGTGSLSNVRGDGLQVFTGSGFDFTIAFDLKGVDLDDDDDDDDDD